MDGSYQARLFVGAAGKIRIIDIDIVAAVVVIVTGRQWLSFVLGDPAFQANHGYRAYASLGGAGVAVLGGAIAVIGGLAAALRGARAR